MAFSDVGKKVIEGGGWRARGKTRSGCGKADRDGTGQPLWAMATFVLRVLDTTEDSVPQRPPELSSVLTIGKRASPFAQYPLSGYVHPECQPGMASVGARLPYFLLKTSGPGHKGVWSGVP